ncbi:Yip1 family protein [Methanoregula sp. UBA64]|jgi:hypothetical protein|uniref:Yip1 family protein n=1 Tax=Methanoregula sp. UBA64 TaxID=1915554 RepID=UPI0025E380FB|nr:Yip1 family protein [Methanoregula sp. UBA64]
MAASDAPPKPDSIVDYLFYPDAFFARLFSRDSSTILPMLLILLSAVPGILTVAYVSGFIRQYIPMTPSVGMGEGILALVSTVLFWTVAASYFYHLSGSPESRSFKKPEGWERAGRIVTCCGYAIVPLIVAQFIGFVLIAAILSGVAIVPPPTTAFEKYTIASSEFDSVEVYTDGKFGLDSDRLFEKGQKLGAMNSAENNAKTEARNGIENVSGQLSGNSFVAAHDIITLILTIVAMIWSGLLLIIGLKHALGAPQQTTLLVAIPLVLIVIVTLIMNLRSQTVV